MTATATIRHLGLKRETAKAVLVDCQIGYCSSVGRKVGIWFPRSQVVAVSETEIEVKAWIAARKLEELAAGGITPWFE